MTLKHSFILAAAFVALSACSKVNTGSTGKDEVPEEEIPAEVNRTAHFCASQIDTKLTFDAPVGTSYPVLWTDNDQNVKYNINKEITIANAAVIKADDGKTATFDITVPESVEAPYEFRFIAPAGIVKGFNKDSRVWNLEIAGNQTPSETSVDKKALILAAWTDALEEIPASTMDLEFRHVTAYGNMTITNLPASAGEVSNVTLTFDENVAGQFFYDDGTISEKSATNVIILNTTSLENIWFGCAPASTAGTDVTITVSTEGGDYSKTITFKEGHNFEAGKIARFSVDFSGVHSSSDIVYSLVTSADALSDNDEVIIVNTEKAKAISTTQNKNNRASSDILIDDNGTIRNPASNVQTLTVTLGEGNSIAFFTGSAYLGPVEADNNCYLREIDNLAEAYLTLSIDEEGNTAMCRGEYTLKYYGKNDVFNMFLSSTGKPVQIYKRN